MNRSREYAGDDDTMAGNTTEAAGEVRPPATRPKGRRAPIPFMRQLHTRWHEAKTLLCVGLDGEIERMPHCVRTGATGILSLEDEREGSYIESALVTFHLAIIDATADLVCAFKPNTAFYEAYGPAGWRALIRIITYIHVRYPGVPVLLDAKRGDIGSTSQAYARMAFDTCAADAVTLQPYLGREALSPFLDRADRGMFILCRTSNPGSGEFQSLRVTTPDSDGPAQGEPLYLTLARHVAGQWNTKGNCALVVGATYPDELRRVRAIVGDMPILVPGIGAQGGDLQATLQAGLDSQRAGLIISASRSVLYASDGLDFANAARHEALRLRDEIERLRKTQPMGDEE
ncbi:MAG: orotidine-5'-phosphate decarboxylase [Ktedonobacterales bacterium]